MAERARVVEFEFPLSRPLTGICLGNGVVGLMVWGDETLNVTIARAGFWDHRGAMPAQIGCTFQQLRAWLEAGQQEKAKAAFASPAGKDPWRPRKPYQLGGGRLVLRFPAGLVPDTARLDLSRGSMEIRLAAPDGRAETVTLTQSAREEVACIELPAGLAEAVEMELIPAWRWIGEKLASWSVPPAEVDCPDELDGAHTILQRLPEDPALAIAARRRGSLLTVATALGRQSDDDPRPVALERLDAQARTIRRESELFWSDICDRTPQLDLPDATLMRMYHYGLARLVGCTSWASPEAVASGLQGPFMEDDALPPWSNDYHTNINVQMMYRPLLATNLHQGYRPLWKMMQQWLPVMRNRGEGFFQAPGSMMLHHASDDRCQVFDGLWIGTIDHGCCAWMARHAWLHYRYSGDESILRQVAWPLLVGAFEGYYAMSERKTDPDGVSRLHLPVSVSPEYHGSGQGPWGADASFQLAAWHSVVEMLSEAAVILGEGADPRWQEVRRDLPEYTLIDERPDVGGSGPAIRVWRGWESSSHIGVWAGEDLNESHRHHSHMACFYPFETVDPLDPSRREIVGNTYDAWIYRGAGYWTGWCLTWASILCSRFNRPTAAVSWLHWLDVGFTNEGGNTNHDAAPGLSILEHRSAEKAWSGQGHEIIQLDAALGAVSAILEILVQPRRDGVHVLPALPVGWRNLRFDNVGVPGGFRIGATVRRGHVIEVRVASTRAGTLRLAHHLGAQVLVDGQPRSGEVLELTMPPGQEITVRRA